MSSLLSAKRQYSERSNFGFSRARDIAFEAIRELWEQRQKAGMKQTDIAHAIGRDPAWVSRQLSGPGNWTLRTLGELCEGLDGELEIIAHRIEIPESPHSNYHAYSGYGTAPAKVVNGTRSIQVFRPTPEPRSDTRIVEFTR